MTHLETSEQSSDVDLAVVPVSVIVPVKNDDSNLLACLKQLVCFDDVVVVDSEYSTTAESIAQIKKSKYVVFTYEPPFPKKRNWALESLDLKYNWVLFLDADEYITPEFITELRETFTSKENDIAGYWLNYKIRYQGKVLKYGVPQRKLALFNRKNGRYEKIEDIGWSVYDMEIHEHPIIDGEIAELHSEIFHMENIEYAKWEVGRSKLLIESSSRKNLTFRQRVKYYLLGTPFLAPGYFIYHYIFRLGILDGKLGLSYAILKMTYFFQIYLLANER